MLNNENVWAKAMNRVVNEKVPVDKAVDEMIARIKASPAEPLVDASSACQTMTRRARTSSRRRRPRRQGAPRSLAASGARSCSSPYVLVFLVFVLYPVGYGLWLARHPASYVKLFDDPIFFRTSSTR